MATNLEFFASCPLGINDLLSKELASFGATDLKESAAGVSFKGTLETRQPCPPAPRYFSGHIGRGSLCGSKSCSVGRSPIPGPHLRSAHQR
jgi:hypothetical protein